MASQINLCSVQELDRNYEHVMDFNSKTSQLNFFNKKIVERVEFDFKGDGFRKELTVPLAYDDTLRIDYCYFTGEDNKTYFYFVDSKEFKTRDVTVLHLTLDVFNTYLFDFELLHSFVERCHVNRWKVAGSIPNETQIVDEGFPEFQSVIGKKSVIPQMLDGVYVYASTIPLGTGITDNKGSGGGGGVITKGVITKQGFRFIKGFEGFTPTGCYLNGEDFKTVGYGSTEKYNKDYYDKHKPFPCTEQTASEIYAERIINEFGKLIYEELKQHDIINRVSLNMFDAMCSLAYNRGVYGFLYDDTSPFRAIIKNPTDFTSIRNAWENYAVTSNGNVLSGLVARRKAEMNIYECSEYEMRAIIKYKVVNETGRVDGYVTDNDGNGFIPEYLPDVNQLPDKGDIVDGDGNTWMLPTSGKITASFPNYPDGSYHGGVDFANNQGTPIYATGDGIVYSKQMYQGDKTKQPYGNLLIIEQEGNKTKQTYRMYYAHLNEFAQGISEGVRVTKGELIGYMGTTGNSTGNHLHYEQRVYPYSPQTDTAIHPAVGLVVNKEV